jgi:hypothetical protein
MGGHSSEWPPSSFPGVALEPSSGLALEPFSGAALKRNPLWTEFALEPELLADLSRRSFR